MDRRLSRNCDLHLLNQLWGRNTYKQGNDKQHAEKRMIGKLEMLAKYTVNDEN